MKKCFLSTHHPSYIVHWWVLVCSCQGNRHFYPLPMKTSVGRVNWPVTKHLNGSGQAGSKGRAGLRCFCCPNKTWTPPLAASDTLTIVQNGLEMRKLCLPPRPFTMGGLKLKKTNHWTIQRWILEHSKYSLYVVMLLGGRGGCLGFPFLRFLNFIIYSYLCGWMVFSLHPLSVWDTFCPHCSSLYTLSDLSRLVKNAHLLVSLVS
jgi:hypothetical protein